MSDAIKYLAESGFAVKAIDDNTKIFGGTSTSTHDDITVFRDSFLIYPDGDDWVVFLPEPGLLSTRKRCPSLDDAVLFLVDFFNNQNHDDFSEKL